MTGKRQNMHGFERKRAKQADRRRAHQDKYADMQSNDASPAESVESEEYDREQR